MDATLLYELLWQIGTMPTQQHFAVSFSQLNIAGFFESRKAFVGNDSNRAFKLQYRLTEEAAALMPKVKRGRRMGNKPPANCNWLKPPTQRLRSVV